MRDPIRKSLRKWAVGVGCTLSVALLFNNAKNSDAFQGAVQSITNGNHSSSLQQDGSSSAQDDPVIQEWQDQQSQDSSNDSGTFSDGGSSGFGDSFGGGRSSGGFRSRSGHS
ncbi:hypothetical protein [Cohnella candidum]|uniref:hypothetical protein n=1 Tax=Cohnella candidum TaxID=2674991 RepID=UPI0013DDF8D2|nr:hypothetical protein [Cohnella candidum]